MFLGTTLPVPDLDGSMHAVTIGPCVIEAIDGHKRGVGAASHTMWSVASLQLSPAMQGDDSVLSRCSFV